MAFLICSNSGKVSSVSPYCSSYLNNMAVARLMTLNNRGSKLVTIINVSSGKVAIQDLLS
jgi:hypothetical protein